MARFKIVLLAFAAAVLAATVFVAGNQHRGYHWPEQVKKERLDRCVLYTRLMGAPAEFAQKYCQCAADGLERERPVEWLEGDHDRDTAADREMKARVNAGCLAEAKKK